MFYSFYFDTRVFLVHFFRWIQILILFLCFEGGSVYQSSAWGAKLYEIHPEKYEIHPDLGDLVPQLQENNAINRLATVCYFTPLSWVAAGCGRAYAWVRACARSNSPSHLQEEHCFSHSCQNFVICRMNSDSGTAVICSCPEELQFRQPWQCCATVSYNSNNQIKLSSAQTRKYLVLRSGLVLVQCCNL